ncbi:unnamed protein product [Caenorhabditis angaria]|uniref:Nuclear receptor domain-containing protein n=1 Tax=Caenorhabditis angaria TaxID=860376 RepID=A0A9P1IUS0_9PELO|nr:unnamed protein product [Caenorhabditis angaria]
MQKKCTVCEETADANHFGAMTCRACAAFFRRKVATRNRIIRRCDRKCVMNSTMRKLCASCRFERCLKVGMRESEVLSKIYEQKKRKVETDNAISLKRIETFYTHLENVKKCEFLRKENSFPKMANYKVFNEAFKKYADLITENIILAFPEVQSLSDDQKNTLFKNFTTVFVIIEGCYKSKSEKIWILPNGDYVDDDNAVDFYKDPESKDDAQKLYELNKAEWKSTSVNLRSRIASANMDRKEFLLLTALVFWDGGLPEQSNDVTVYCQEMRQKVMKELSKYENMKHDSINASMRVAEIVLLLQGTQSVIETLQKSSSLTYVYNFFEHYNLFQPYWDRIHIAFRGPLEDANLNQIEFFYLFALIFWDDGLVDQSEKMAEICQKMRQKVIKELIDYENEDNSDAETSIRIAKIFMILPAIQSTLRIIDESAKLNAIYDVYDHHKSVHQSLGL